MAVGPPSTSSSTPRPARASARSSRVSRLLFRELTYTAYHAYISLDIIGRVAFGHDFKSGQSTEAKQIRASWEGHVNGGITFGAFIAMLVIRACPSIFLLPLPAIKAGGRIKEIVTKLSTRLVERGTFSDRGRDILSILMKAESESQRGAHSKAKAKAERLTPQQIVDNVSARDLSRDACSARRTWGFVC